VVAIAAGWYHSLALKSDGTVVGWGGDFIGQATPPAGLTGVVAIATSTLHSLALKSDGTVVGWGDNDNGEATPPAGLTRVAAIAAGGSQSLAMTCGPQPPLGLTATLVSSNQVGLTWSDYANDEDGFKIERAPDNAGAPGTWAQIATVSANVTNYSDTGVSVDTTYWYRVRAYNTGGDSPYSNQASATTPPLPPSGLTVMAVSESQINLAWVNNSNTETGFFIERAPDSGGAPGAWTQIATVGAPTTAYSDTGLLPLTKYWYRVRAYNVGGDSDYTSLASITTEILSAPSGLTATGIASNQINLAWIDNSSYEDGYAIERAPDNGGVPGTWIQVATVSSNVTAYSDIGLLPNTTYWYHVRAFNVNGNSDYSNQAGATTLPLPPTAPSGLTAAPLSGSVISLSWTDNTNDETGFAVERAPDAGGSPGTWIQIATVNSNVTTYISGGLMTNTTYWYRVRASNTGGYSPYSNQANATTFANLPDSWISPSSGKWETAGSWSLGVDPSVYLLGILVTNVGSKTVTIDGTTVSNFSGTLTISNLTVSAASGATNTLLLTTGGSPTPLHVSQGISIGPGGLMDVENSSLQVDELLQRGFNIDGTLLFQNGGKITLSSKEFGGQIAVGNVATGQMTVAAGTVAASTMNVGNVAGSQGTLTISGVATVRCSSVSIGQLANATGTVWMTGGQLTTTNGGQPNVLYVGNTGSGQMTVSNGMVLTSRAYVGYAAGSHGTLTVAGGSVTISSLLNIGSVSTAAGAVWVTGGRLVLTNGSAIVGGSGAGQLTVTVGTLQALSMTVGQLAGSQGSLIISGGTATVWSSLVIGDCATTASGQVTVVSGGSLYVTNASHTAFLDVRNGTVIVGNGGLLVADKIVGTNGCGRIIHTNGGTIIATTLTLDPSLSAAGDGIPNGWKQQYNLDPLDPTAANADVDGDGFSNLQEYLAGTDPTNSASYFHIVSIQPSGSDMLVTWMMGSGKTNALQAMTGSSYNTNNYADIFIVTNTVGPTTNYLDLGAATNAPNRYYRVRLVP